MGLKSSKDNVATNAPANTTNVNANASEKKYPSLSITVGDKFITLGDENKYVSVSNEFDDQKVVGDLLLALWDRANK